MSGPARTSVILDDTLDALDPLQPRPPVLLRLVQDGEPDSPDSSSPRLEVPNDAGAFLERSVAEDGGAAGMPVRRGSQHQYRAVLHEAIVRVADALDVNGVSDRHGRLRRSWLTSLEGLIREARAIDGLLDRAGPADALPAERRDARPRATQPGDPHDGGSAAPPPMDRLPQEIEAFLERMDCLTEPDEFPDSSA